MHTHRIEILDGTNNHTVVLAVAHHFHLEFFPAHERFFDQHFVDRRKSEPARSDYVQFLAIVSDATAGTAESKCRTNNQRERSDLAGNAIKIGKGTGDAGTRYLKSDAQHRFLK